jgi:hypothetical protein
MSGGRMDNFTDLRIVDNAEKTTVERLREERVRRLVEEADNEH